MLNNKLYSIDLISENGCSCSGYNNSDTYDVSSASLPEVDVARSEYTEDHGSLSEISKNEGEISKISIFLNTNRTEHVGSFEKPALTLVNINKNTDIQEKHGKKRKPFDQFDRNFPEKINQILQSEHELESSDSVPLTNKLNQVSRGDPVTFNTYSNSIKIKLSFSSEKQSREATFSPEKCFLEIQLSGVNKNCLKQTNNKKIQVCTNQGMSNEERSQSDKIINFKELKFCNKYASITTNASLIYPNPKSLKLPSFQLKSCESVAVCKEPMNNFIRAPGSPKNEYEAASKLNLNKNLLQNPFKYNRNSISRTISTSSCVTPNDSCNQFNDQHKKFFRNDKSIQTSKQHFKSIKLHVKPYKLSTDKGLNKNIACSLYTSKYSSRDRSRSSRLRKSFKYKSNNSSVSAFNFESAKPCTKDTFVQTIPIIKDQDQTEVEDVDMIKLGMLLEIINCSEYNIYNTKDDLTEEKEKLLKSRIEENERDFQEFIKEIMPSNYTSSYNRDAKFKLRSINTLEKNDYRNNFFQYVYNMQENRQKLFQQRKNEWDTKYFNSSLESVNLEDDYNFPQRIYNVGQLSYNQKEYFQNFSKNSPTDFTRYPTLKQLITSLLTPALIYSNNEKYLQPQNDYSIYSLPEGRFQGFWARLNYFLKYKTNMLYNKTKQFQNNERRNYSSDAAYYNYLSTNNFNEW